MFQREEHRAVLRVLRALDADLLRRRLALFGGGTRLVLELGEYRISQAIDFLSSEPRTFAELRNLARRRGPEAFFDGESHGGIGDPGFQSRCFSGLSVSAPEEVLDGARLLFSDLEVG